MLPAATERPAVCETAKVRTVLLADIIEIVKWSDASTVGVGFEGFDESLVLLVKRKWKMMLTCELGCCGLLCCRKCVGGERGRSIRFF